MRTVALFATALIAYSAAEHSYTQGDLLPLFANKVGPFANPSETYEYYTLPFCKPAEDERKGLDLGEAIGGDRLVKTTFKIQFNTPVDKADVCGSLPTLDSAALKHFHKAVDEDYYFEFFCDDLPLWGFLGDKETVESGGQNHTMYYLFSHYIFTLSYNGDKVIDVNWEHDPDKKLDITDVTKPIKLEMQYSVKWKPSTVAFDDRMTKYQQSFQPQHLEIHWFSIFNSFVTVLLLTSFLATILLRILKNDFSRYASEEDEEEDDEEETGWKLLHGDVFRFPERKMLFCAMLGNGAQLFFLVFGLLLLALFGVFYPYNRGGIFTAALVLFALTSGVAGYVGSSFYKKIGGDEWVWTIILTSVLFIGPLFATGTFVNFVAISYNAANALPFGTIVVIIMILSLVGFPLVVVGGIAGRNLAQPFEAPCRTTKVPREIPPLPWYRQPAYQVVMAGFLPFSAIYIELYYIFAAVWGHKLYTIYGILFLVWLILLIVTSFITIALTYFQLAIEDHRWWWRSFFSGGSTGIFVLGYCFFYFHYRSEMSGFLQSTFFFAYMAIVCYAFFLMLGTVGFVSALTFIKYIYRAIKCD